MAWDDTKQAEDDWLAEDYNDLVSAVKATPSINSPEHFLGSAASGENGQKNRQITLSNTSLTQEGGFFVFVEGRFQHTSDISVNHQSSNTVITFKKRLFNTDNITVIYITG